MLYAQLPEFAVLSVLELADICASLELLSDPMALGRVGVRVDSLFARSHCPRRLVLVAGVHSHSARRHFCAPCPVG